VAEIVYGSEPVQGSEGGGARAVRRVCPQDRKNDRKTTGFTKPLRPELNLSKEKVKVLVKNWGEEPVENLKSGHLWSGLVRFGHLRTDEPVMKRL
jgi:hypothetical protein